MNVIDFHSYYTLLMLIVFIGICFWAWSSKRKKFFSEAANLPFADEEISAHSAQKLQEEENKHE